MTSLLGLCTLGAEAPLPHLQALLVGISDHNGYLTQNKDELQSIVSLITNFLSRGVTRIRGLIILKSLLESKISLTEILINHGPTWLPLCINTLKPGAVSAQEKSLALSVIKDLLESSSKIHELDRSIVGTALTELTENLVKCQTPLHYASLSCLQTLLLRYARSSGAFKASIEKYLIQFLDSRDKKSVVYAAKCCHLLQQVRGGGEQGINYKNAWKNQFELYIHCASLILKEIRSITNDSNSYENISYFVDNSSSNAELDISLKQSENRPFHIVMKNICRGIHLSDIFKKDFNEDENTSISITDKIERLFIRLENLLVFIQSMLIDPYPVAKSIRCNSILDLLLQCLALKCKISNQQITLDTMAVVCLVPGLYCAVMRTIEAFILCIRSNVFPYTTLLLKVILQALQSTKTENHNYGVKPFKNIRKAAYRALYCLFLNVHTLRPPPQEREQGFEDRLLSNLMDDICYLKPSMQLYMKNVGTLRNMSKKARNKLTMSQLEASNLPQNVSQANTMNNDYDDVITVNIDLIQSALLCLEAFFKASGAFLKQNTHKTVQEAIIKQIYTNSTNKKLKEALLKTLFAIQIFQSKQQPSILSHCVDTFSRSQNCEDFKIRELSYSTLNNCLDLIRGNAPPLLLPSPQQNTINLVTALESKSLENNSTSHENCVVIDLDDVENDTQKRVEKDSWITIMDNHDVYSLPLEDNHSEDCDLPIKKRKVDTKTANSSEPIKSPDKMIHEIFDSDSENDCSIAQPQIKVTETNHSCEKVTDKTECNTEKDKNNIDIAENNNLQITNGSVPSKIIDATTQNKENILIEDDDMFCVIGVSNKDKDVNLLVKKEFLSLTTTTEFKDSSASEVNLTQSNNEVNPEVDAAVVSNVPEKQTENPETAVDTKEGASLEEMMGSFVDEVIDEYK